MAAALATLVAVTVIWWAGNRPGTVASSEVLHTFVVPPEDATFATGGPNPQHAISPDGRTLAFVADSADGSWIWLQPFDAPRAWRLDRTESAEGLFWAPDSLSIGFMTPDALRRVDVDTGVVRDIVETTFSYRSASWGSQGVILIGTLRQGIVRVPENGGAVIPVTQPSSGSIFHYYPHFLPDGDHFLCTSNDEGAGIYVASVNTPSDERSSSKLLDVFGNAAFVPGSGESSGYLLFPRQGVLYAQQFDPEQLALQGQEVVIAEDVDVLDGQEYAQYSVSRTGRLATSPSSLVEVTEVSRTGETIGIRRVAGSFTTMRPSPDGRRVVLFPSTSLRCEPWIWNRGHFKDSLTT